MLRTLLSIVTLSLAFAHSAESSAAQTSPATRPSTKAQAAAVVVNINTASVVELGALPGIGAKTAALIVEYRQKNGPFKKIEELMNVRGVGEKSFLKLKPQLTVTASKTERPNQ